MILASSTFFAYPSTFTFPAVNPNFKLGSPPRSFSFAEQTLPENALPATSKNNLSHRIAQKSDRLAHHLLVLTHSGILSGEIGSMTLSIASTTYQPYPFFRTEIRESNAAAAKTTNSAENRTKCNQNLGRTMSQEFNPHKVHHHSLISKTDLSKIIPNGHVDLQVATTAAQS